MGIFGLGSAKKGKKPAANTKAKKTVAKKAKGGNSEAKAVLAKMKAKKDAGDCAFC